MRIEELLGSGLGIATEELYTLNGKCKQFLRESKGLPLLKALPRSYSSFQRVKVRRKKQQTHVTEVFDKAFGSTFQNLTQRAIFAYPAEFTVTEDVEPFYVFPIDGYQYLYSKEVTNSSSDYQQVIDTLFEKFDDETKATEIITDLLKYTYSSSNLSEGIQARAEIILYGIPYYYAVRASEVSSYDKLITITHK